MIHMTILIVASVSLFTIVKPAKSKNAVLTFKDVTTADNTVFLKFENASHKVYLFDALKSNLKPFIFYTTSQTGNVEVNVKIKNSRFKLQYGNWPADKKLLYIITLKEVP